MKKALSISLCICIALFPLVSVALSWGSIFSSLTDDELLAMHDELEDELIARGLASSSKDTKKSVLEPMVWIPRSGSKYHKKSTCSNMKNPNQIALSEAIRLGYEPCKRCKP